MSGNLQEEETPMEVDSQEQAGMASAKDTDEAVLYLALKWSDLKKRRKRMLEMSLQTWFNCKTNKLNCKVREISADGIAEITVQPPPGENELKKLHGQDLSLKDGAKVTIVSVSLVPIKPDGQTAGNASVSPPPSSLPALQADNDVPMAHQSDPGLTAGNASDEDKKKPQDSCLVPVFQFLYMSNIYKEEIARIEKKYGVQMEAQASVTFNSDSEDNQQQALSEFTNLVQKHLSDVSVSVIPAKFVDPDQWSDALKISQKKENKLMLTLFSDKITVFGPSHCQQAFTSTLNNAIQKTNGTFEEEELQDTSFKIKMTIKDDLADAGLTMEESSWKLLTTSFDVAKIKDKFDVDFKVSTISKGKVNIKAFYITPEGNASMESHAIRALLDLYQKTATSVLNFTQFYGATGFSGSLKNMKPGYNSEKTFSGPAQSTGSALQNTKARSGEEATAGDSKDETCPICLDPFKMKKQLKCKHEFCEKCLENAEKHSGPICPVCKNVFGVITGDQPEGTMTWITHRRSLPGFKDCGHIVITYHIQSGRQTEKHPNPGQHYTGTTRYAYLPDNKEGREVVLLLKKAFDQKLIFTIGASRTTGAENMVTWNDIHHKTSPDGGPERYGYPDQNYLKRVKEELKAKGIM